MAPRLLACSQDFSARRLRTAASSAFVILAATAVLTGSEAQSLVKQFKLSNVYNRSMRSMAAMGKSEMQSLRRVARLAFALL